MNARNRTALGITAVVSLGVLLGGCKSDGAGAPVTPENSIVAKPPQTRGATEQSTVAPRPGRAPGQPGAVGPGAPGGAGGR